MTRGRSMHILRWTPGRMRVMFIWLLMLVVVAPLASAGFVGEAVASNLALPILRGVRGWAGINETTGTEPFLQAFINGQVVPYVNSCHVLLPDGEPDCDQIEGDCAESADACEYIYATETLVGIGTILAILLTAALLSSCVMSCCCTHHSSWDAGPEDGRREDLAAKTQKSSLHLVPAIVAGAALVTLAGFIITIEFGFDVLALLEGIKTGTSVPEDARARANWALLKVSLLQKEFIEEKVRLRIAPEQGLRELRLRVGETREALRAVKTSAESLEEFVEGCIEGDTACGATGSDWNLCEFNAGDGKGEHPVGAGARISNGAGNPACRDARSGAPAACPCCKACHGLSTMVDRQLLALPSDDDIDALNVTLPPEEILPAAVDTVNQYRPSVESVQEPLQSVNDSMVHAEDVVSSQMYKLVGLDLLLWAPAVGALCCVFAALRRVHVGLMRDLNDTDGDCDGAPMRDGGKHAEEERKRGALRLLHFSFYCGMAFTAAIAAPGFAVLSVGALPLADVCEIIPTTNGSASALLRVFEIPGLPAGLHDGAHHLVTRGATPGVAPPSPRPGRSDLTLTRMIRALSLQMWPAGEAAGAVASLHESSQGGGGIAGGLGRESRGSLSPPRRARADVERLLEPDLTTRAAKRRLLVAQPGRMGGVAGIAVDRGQWGVGVDVASVSAQDVAGAFAAGGGVDRDGDVARSAYERVDGDAFPPDSPDVDGASLPRRLIEDCLCKAEGSAWGVLGVSDTGMQAHLKMRNASTILTPAILNRALGLLQYEGISEIYESCYAFTSPTSHEYDEFGVNDCATADLTAFPTCRADMASYSGDLSKRRRELRAAAAALEVALSRLQDVNLEVQQNVTRLMSASDYYTKAMYTVVWQAGSCDLLHSRYENVRGPLCDGVVGSVLAVWSMLLLASVLWILLLLTVTVIMGSLTASLPSRRLSWGESEYSLLLDVEDDSPRRDLEQRPRDDAPGAQ